MLRDSEDCKRGAVAPDAKSYKIIGEGACAKPKIGRIFLPHIYDGPVKSGRRCLSFEEASDRADKADCLACDNAATLIRRSNNM